MCASSARRAAGGALLGLVLLVTGGCSSGSPEAAPSPSPTPIAALDTASVQLPRISFCSLVPRPAVAAALGGPAADGASWGNGDELDLGTLSASASASGSGSASGSTEKVQELGCAWTRGEATARAWVFARPVTPALARGVVRQAGRERGCETPQAPAFGSPSLVQVCGTDAGRRVRHAGLFGQTWLTCEVGGTETAAVLADRAEQWCVTLVNSLDTAS